MSLDEGFCVIVNYVQVENPPNLPFKFGQARGDATAPDNCPENNKAEVVAITV